jgi:hypothetical protein
MNYFSLFIPLKTPHPTPQVGAKYASNIDLFLTFVFFLLSLVFSIRLQFLSA